MNYILLKNSISDIIIQIRSNSSRNSKQYILLC